MRTTLACLARGALASVIIVSVVGLTPANAAGKVYTNKTLHYSLTIPAAWIMNPGFKSSDVGAIEATINPVALIVASPDKAAHFMVMVKTATTTDAAITANIAGMLKEGPPLVGKVKFGTAKFNGVTYISGSATEKVSPTLTAYGYIDAVRHDGFTFYAGGAYLLKQPGSATDYAAMQSMMAGLILR